MINRLFGRKLGMTQYFLGEGNACPVTILKVGPCVVTQKKTRQKEGYSAIQVGYEPQKDKRVNKPLRGHFNVAGKGCFSVAREIRVEDSEAFELGQELKSDIFQIGERVQITGISKGRGFSGVIKRWGFSGGRKTHGSRSHRIPGSIGSSATPGRVMKGKKLPGRYGNARVTIKNLKVVDVRPEMDLIMVKGAVPGSVNSLVEVRKS
jgi:large subunit ribosomal protein L3